MKESVEFVQALVGLANPWTIGIALALAAPFVFKLLLEIASMSHATREKRLGLLLKYLDAGFDKSPRFSVEQAFRHNYGVLVEFDIIERLWQHVSPSLHVQNYIWGSGFLEFDREKREFQLKQAYNWKARATGLLVLFAAAYVVAVISFFAGFYLLRAGDWAGALKTFALCALMGAGVWLVVMAARASRAARHVVEQQNDTQKKLTAEDRSAARSDALAHPVPA